MMPEPIDANDLKTPGNMKQTAVQQYSLSCVLPYFVASKIPESNTGVIHLLLKITLFSTITCANREMADDLNIVIHEYLYHFIEWHPVHHCCA